MEILERGRLFCLTCCSAVLGGKMHALGDLPAWKDELLPNLSSIFEDVERSEIDDIVVKECEDGGVKMEFWQPST